MQKEFGQTVCANCFQFQLGSLGCVASSGGFLSLELSQIASDL